ncbi:MAG: hypothetical protein MUO26_03505 [Methanotrichaceae archaeon]|nr:hypothetical protein [Methanotrichaceae archaeon]
MIDAAISLSPVKQAFVATCFTWLLTALGASTVFMAKEVRKACSIEL